MCVVCIVFALFIRKIIFKKLNRVLQKCSENLKESRVEGMEKKCRNGEYAT